MDILIATKNSKKLEEFSRILASFSDNVFSLSEISDAFDDVDETGTTFAENAHLKASSACQQTGHISIADDSGLVVDALGGNPGVFSARYAGENASDADRMNKLLSAMKEVPNLERTAHFQCAICCVFPNGDVITAEGRCDGVIGLLPKGNNGFGYDPIFTLQNGISFAELSDEEKDKVSHRGKALRRFKKKSTIIYLIIMRTTTRRKIYVSK